MFSILSPDQYSAVEPLFESISHNLVIHTMIKGHPAGKIWANDKNSPSAALIWDRMDEFLFLGGEPESEETVHELQSIFVNDIIAVSKERGGESLVLQCSSESWTKYIPKLLEGTEIIEKQKILYVFDSQSTLWDMNWRDRIPTDYSILRFDKELSNTLENYDDAVTTTGYVWGDFDKFTQGGAGFCVITDDKLVSRCVTDFVRRKEYELYIETEEEFQRKGLATLATTALVEHLNEKGHSLIWHCWGDNEGSIKVAERVGFRREKVSLVYDFDYTKLSESL
ncbi:MAG: GNAT family N-acetyltransferase [Candidatus Thorarchaeota archaeon]|jgi:RimJ/RimL family protein N-acetyltransferase